MTTPKTTRATDDSIRRFRAATEDLNRVVTSKLGTGFYGKVGVTVQFSGGQIDVVRISQDESKK